MEFRDIHGVVFSKFHQEWDWGTIPSWNAFINSKDLGIEFYVDDTVSCYLVKDEKKWALTRIKYGI